MIQAGIEAMNAFTGTVYLDVGELSGYRQLDARRFDNLLMKEKTVALPYEDPVTFGVNAAKPLIDAMTAEEKNRIELLITCTESGIDFGKSVSTYIHHYLGLSRNCRMAELKQACYSGTAGMQMAINFILSRTSPGAKALVIATDISRFMVTNGSSGSTEDWSFAEPSAGAGAVAMLIGESPHIFQLDTGASGFYGYEVMDTCRPIPDSEAGNADLSLMCYLDCCEQAFLDYQRKVVDVSYIKTFDYLAFHTPFGGMVKGAHRNMMRKLLKAKTDEIEQDFRRRVDPGLNYCSRVGNIMGATIFLSLVGIIDQGNFDTPVRIGCFSYGSGCCSEFYSGVVTPEGQRRLKNLKMQQALDERYRLTMKEYELLLQGSSGVKFGTRNVSIDRGLIAGALETTMKKRGLVLSEIIDFHRRYEWLS